MHDPLMIGQYTPGTASFGQLYLQGDGINTINGPIHAAAGITGSRAWLYQYLEPADAVASSLGGRGAATFQSVTLTSGTVYEFAIPVEAGLTVCALNLCSVSGQSGGLHAWVGLADSSNNVLAVSEDQTVDAYFTADTLVSTDLPRTAIPYTGLYYLFVCVVAATMPTFASSAAPVSAALSSAPPFMCGTSLTGQTDPVAVGSNLGPVTPAAGYQLYGYLQ